jgi:hypothetical protein
MQPVWMCLRRNLTGGLPSADVTQRSGAAAYWFCHHETRYGMAACAVDNLIDALNGNVEKNCVNPQVLK